MSDRLGIPSTKYGPSVCCGVPSASTNGVSVHDLLVDELIWVADSSRDGGGNPEAGALPVRVGNDEEDVVGWLLPSNICAKEFGKSIKNGYVKIMVRDSIIATPVDIIVILCVIFSLSFHKIMLILAAPFLRVHF
jgi:hypothetical protein